MNFKNTILNDQQKNAKHLFSFADKFNFSKILKHFAIAVDILFVLMLVFNYINFLPNYWNMNYIFYFFVFVNTVFFTDKIRQMSEEEKKDSKLVYIFGHFFLLSLIVIAANQFLQRQVVIDFLPHISVVAVAFGFLTFYSNRERVEREIVSDKVREDELEKQRYADFPKKFPKLLRVPVLGRVVRWMYKEGFWYVVLLILILIMFTAIKYPYFNVSFTGEHSMKYNGYVEPAILMYKTSSILPNIKLFESNPLINFYGEYDSIGGHIPLTQWGILIFYKLFPNNSFEYNTRLFMNFLGIIIIFISFFLYKEIFDKKSSIIFVFLISISPTLNLISFLTVADTMMFIFLFLSFLFLFLYKKNGKDKTLFLAIIFSGISFISKDTSLFFSLPVFTFILWNKKKFGDFIFNIFFFFILTISFKLSYYISLYNLPKNIMLYLLFSFLISLFYIFLYFIFSNRKLKNFLYKKKKFTIIILSTIFILSLFFIYRRLGVYFLGFITSKNLILNLNFYEYLINNKIIPIMSNSFFILGSICFLIGLAISKIRKIFLIFGASMLFFFIFASKVIYFHTYYRFYFSYIFSFFIPIILTSKRKLIFNKKKIWSYLIIILFLVYLFSSTIPITKNFLAKSKSGAIDASNFLIKNQRNNEFFMFNREAHILSIYSLRNSFDFHKLNTPEFKEEISRNGIKNTFKNYHIKYYITTNSDPKFDEIIAIISPKFSTESISSLREDIILKEINNNKNYLKNFNLRITEINNYDLENHFKLVKNFGDYYIYEII